MFIVKILCFMQYVMINIIKSQSKEQWDLFSIENKRV